MTGEPACEFGVPIVQHNDGKAGCLFCFALTREIIDRYEQTLF